MQQTYNNNVVCGSGVEEDKHLINNKVRLKFFNKREKKMKKKKNWVSLYLMSSKNKFNNEKKNKRRPKKMKINERETEQNRQRNEYELIVDS